MLVDEAKYTAGKRTNNGSVTGDGSFTWIGLVDATEAELAKYQRRFRLNDLAVEDALSGKQRPKLNIYREHSLLVLKTISYDVGSKRIAVGDVTLFLGNDYVITVRHGDALPLRSIRANLENQPQRLYFVKRELIEFRRAILPLVQPIEHFAAGKVPHINPDSALLFSDVRDNLLKVIDEVELMNELMDAALHANSSLIQVQQNIDIRKISAWAAIGAVPTMIGGLYGMNFDYMPELEWRYGYFIVVGLLVVVSATLFRLFRKYKWL